jgi:hypothetical protein
VAAKLALLLSLAAIACAASDGTSAFDTPAGAVPDAGGGAGATGGAGLGPSGTGGAASLTSGGSATGGSATGGAPPRLYADPGREPWVLVPHDRVAEECRLDPTILASITYTVPWLIVRYGKMCWASGGALADAPAQNFSTTKTLSAATLGILAHQTRDLPRSGRKTGPVSDEDRIDHWLDPLEYGYNADAHVAHVLAMTAHNASLAFGQKRQSYDTFGTVQINSLVTVMNRAIAQDPTRLGANLAEFAQRHVFGPLGMTSSTWDTTDLSGLTGWHSTVGDMARLGLLLLHGGVWGGEQILDPEWVYRMTHPAFEDSNTAYGYLTWLNARANWHLADLELFALGRFLDNTKPLVACAPAAIQDRFPHGLSDAPDCGYSPHATCEQPFDVGVWQANGLGGQLIVGQPGLDMVLVTRDFGNATGEGLLTMGDALWHQIVPAVVAHDPAYAGDVAGFCEAYAGSRHAPDLH